MKIPFTKLNLSWKPSPSQKYLQYPLLGRMPFLSYDYSKARYPAKSKVIESIANHFTAIEIEHFNIKEYKSIEDNLTFLFKWRPNYKQTPVEFWYLFFFNLYKYGNSIILPTYDKNNVIDELNILDMGTTSISWINPRNGKTSKKFLYFQNLESEEYYAISYNDIIHQRLNPEQIQNGEIMEIKYNSIPEIIDENLSVILSELKNNFNVKGVFKVGAGLDGLDGTLLDEESKQAKVDDLVNRVKDKILVLDAGESWEEKDGKMIKTSLEDMNALEDKLYELYGVPASIVHNNYTFTEYSAFYRKVLEPKTKSLEQEINYKLLTKKKIKKGERITLRIPITTGIEFKDMITYFDKMKYFANLSTNEIRNTIGKVPIKGGDIYTGNLNMANPDGTKPNNTTKGGDDNE